MDYRSRLLAIYEHYAPEKLKNVDAQLERYVGQEEALIEALVSKYGSEPGSRGGSVEELDYRSRLVAIYEHYTPEKLKNVDAQLTKYAGQEEALIATLVGKYGPEPEPTGTSTGSDYRSQLISIYRQYAPEKLKNVDAQLVKYAGQEEALIEALQRKYMDRSQSALTSTLGSDWSSSVTSRQGKSEFISEYSAARSYRDRVVAMYEYYAPDKLKNADAQLAKYAGQEEALLEALVGKYGPEPEESSRAASAAYSEYRQRLVALYEHYAPEKLRSVDAQLEKYAGQEEALIDALVSKYGPEPELTTVGDNETDDYEYFRRRLVAMYQYYAPEKARSIDAQLAKYAGQEEALIAALVTKYGPEPEESSRAESVTSTDYRARLVAMYEQYAPARLNNVDAQLAKYAGQEEALMAALVSKYGPEPARVEADGSITSEKDFRARLVALYAHYAPEKLQSVDAHLAKYAGQEEALLAALVGKYGPEPGATGATATEWPNAPDFRSRLVAMYEHYAPEKLTNVDVQLAKYAGQEEALMAALVGKYGPEPEPAPAPKPTDDASMEQDYRSRVVAIYEQYAPEKLKNVDAQLEKYAGQEEALIDALTRKYVHGSQSVATSLVASGRSSPIASTSQQFDTSAARSYRDRVVAMYERYAPDKLKNADAQLVKYAGQEEALLEALVGKYGPEPERSSAPTGGDYRSRIVAIYERFAPDKVKNVDAQLEKYAGQEEALIEALQRKYTDSSQPVAASVSASGRSSPDMSHSQTSVFTSASEYGTTRSYRDRVVAMYERYAPDKLKNADAQLAKYAGQEEALLEALVGKYGPEPASVAADPRDYRSRIMAIYARYAPDKMHLAERNLRKYAGQEEVLLEQLQRKYVDGSSCSSLNSSRAPSEGPETASERQREEVAADEDYSRVQVEEERTQCIISLVLDMEVAQRGVIAAEEQVAMLLLVEEQSRDALVTEWMQTAPLGEHPPFPFLNAEEEVSALFRCLGTTDSERGPLIDRDTAEILLRSVGAEASLDVEELRDLPMMDLATFRCALTLSCTSEAAMLQAMAEFVAKCNAKSKPKKTTAVRDLEVGFWAHQLIRPCLDEKWAHVWVMFRNGAVLVRSPNQTDNLLVVDVRRVVSVRLESMLGSRAPRGVAKNGLVLEMSKGPNPLQVILCADTMSHSQALLAVLRRAIAARDAQHVARSAATPDPTALVPAAAPQEGPRATSKPAVTPKETPIWCCQSGFSKYVRSLWVFVGDYIIHRIDGEAKSHSWFIGSIDEVFVAETLSIRPPPLYSKYAFVICFQGGSLFCCAESAPQRSRVVSLLKKALFKLYLSKNLIAKPPLLEATEAGAPGPHSRPIRDAGLNSSAADIGPPRVSAYLSRASPPPRHVHDNMTPGGR